MFADGAAAGETDFIEFGTPAPITLTGYIALLADDSDSGNSPNRGSTTFRLYRTFGPSLPALQLLSEATLTSPYSTAYGSNVIRISDTFDPVTSEFYRSKSSAPRPAARASGRSTPSRCPNRRRWRRWRFR